ncbi:hypothetical protein VKT23_017825 [Stygiomarasmius scandens]|uniref:Cytochrome P450 n=1 Tax=Marasmiellus scandens TaxID=2682957 RepID=A0ABR1IR03_9AGAR
MDTLVLRVAAYTAPALLILILSRKRSKTILSKIPGPPPQSFLLGNQGQYERSPVGEFEAQCTKRYGATFKFTGGWGEEVLMTSDPKALQFILKTSAYSFSKLELALERNRSFIGNSILGSEREVHQRFRKVMLPAFGLPEVTGLVPIFRESVSRVAIKFQGDINKSQSSSIEINAHAWLSRATLDAIGEAVFSHKFGAVEGLNTPLTLVFNNLILDIIGFPSNFTLIMINLLMILPLMFSRLFLFIPTKSNKRMIENLRVSSSVAKEILAEKEAMLDTEIDSKSLISLFLRSNRSENPRTRLTEDEIVGQMNAMMFAGHETTSTALAYVLWELAKNREIQCRARAEIERYYQEARDHEETNIPVTQFGKMAYLNAVIKESLRMNPPLVVLMRYAYRDVVVPLSQPITIGNTRISEIPLKQNTRVMIPITQNPDIWGSDADVFNPDRWLADTKRERNFGVYSNLGTFSDGIHACIGWRIAVYEMQTMLIELLAKFEFEETEDTKNVQRVFSGINVPLVKGNNSQTNIPLKVSLVDVSNGLWAECKKLHTVGDLE